MAFVAAAAAVASAAAGIYSAVSSGSAAAQAARRERERAEKLRTWYEGKAAETKMALGRHIQTMETIRSMDMPAYQQAAQIASIQQGRAAERLTRNRMIGQLPQQVRDAVFGGQAGQYIGREMQKQQQYAAMTQQIFGAASQQQQMVNALLEKGGMAWQQGMATAGKYEYEAGQTTARVAGGIAQGLGQMASTMQEAEQQEAQQAAARAHQKEMIELMNRGRGAAATPAATPAADGWTGAAWQGPPLPPIGGQYGGPAGSGGYPGPAGSGQWPYPF